jgi:hypothetical protein
MLTAMTVASRGTAYCEDSNAILVRSTSSSMPMLGQFSSVEDRQRLVKGKPYQPTAESALVIECRGMANGREQAIFYSKDRSVRIAKHAVCDKIQQVAISRCSRIKRNAIVC